MTIKYPNGKRFQGLFQKSSSTREKVEYGNRGMTLEEDINATNQYYLEHDIAVIHKKPTPVQIVKVDYPARSAAVIKEAYFKLASTTDYNGVYLGKYIDFEAKETRLKSFPLKNIHAHQIEHMKQVGRHGGIAFLLIYFSALQSVFFIEAKDFIPFWERMENGGRKSVSYHEIVKVGKKIPLGFTPRMDYLKEVRRLISEV